MHLATSFLFLFLLFYRHSLYKFSYIFTFFANKNRKSCFSCFFLLFFTFIQDTYLILCCLTYFFYLPTLLLTYLPVSKYFSPHFFLPLHLLFQFVLGIGSSLYVSRLLNKNISLKKHEKYHYKYPVLFLQLYRFFLRGVMFVSL